MYSGLSTVMPSLIITNPTGSSSAYTARYQGLASGNSKASARDSTNARDVLVLLFGDHQHLNGGAVVLADLAQ